MTSRSGNVDILRVRHGQDWRTLPAPLAIETKVIRLLKTELELAMLYRRKHKDALNTSKIAQLDLRYVLRLLVLDAFLSRCSYDGIPPWTLGALWQLHHGRKTKAVTLNVGEVVPYGPDHPLYHSQTPMPRGVDEEFERDGRVLHGFRAWWMDIGKISTAQHMSEH